MSHRMLPPPTADGDVLTLDSAAPAGIAWSTPSGGGGGGGTAASSVVSETSFGSAPAVGVATTYARGDHTHGTPAAPTAASVGADATGTAAAAVAAHEAAADPHPQYLQTVLPADLAGYSQQIVTTTGASTVTLPADAQYVRITCVGSGGDGAVGVTGNNTANRLGGRGGGSGGVTTVTYRRAQLPSNLNCWVSLHNSGDVTLVQSGTSYAGGAVATSLYGEIYAYASSGLSGGLGTGAGGAIAIVANMLPSKFALSVKLLSGSTASAPTSGTPTALSPFGGGTSTSASTSPGTAGGGKTTVAAAAGQDYSALGALFPVRAGGAAGAAGQDGEYHGGDPLGTATTSLAEYLLGYGGTGGGSTLAGTGGAGGAGAPGCGGGGGGAGTVAGGAGGAGGDGWIIIETW